MTGHMGLAQITVVNTFASIGSARKQAVSAPAGEHPRADVRTRRGCSRHLTWTASRLAQEGMQVVVMLSGSSRFAYCAGSKPGCWRSKSSTDAACQTLPRGGSKPSLKSRSAIQRKLLPSLRCAAAHFAAAALSRTTNGRWGSCGCFSDGPSLRGRADGTK